MTTIFGEPEAAGRKDVGDPILAVRGLSAGYGGNPCVREIDIEVYPGEVVALLGRNGAGKTTTIMTMAGELAPLAGEVLWRGQPDRAPLYRKARRGLALVTEERSVFMGLTARENLALGRGSEADALALFPELATHLNRRAGLLSGGQQQILTMARALAGKPAVLLADELSLGLAPLIVARLLASVREAAARGVGVVLVEQRARQALATADRAYVLDRGTIVLQGEAKYLLAHFDEVERAYLSKGSPSTPQQPWSENMPDNTAPTLSGIHNVRIAVSDLAASTQWYEETFGLQNEVDFIEHGVHTGTSLLHPNKRARVILFQSRERAEQLSGFDPIAFEIPTLADLYEWHEHLTALGIEHKAPYQGHLGTVIPAIKDPDGIQIRLYTAERPPA